MKKNGFTLVELLAVIAILALLVIVAMPNIIGMFNNAKASSFESELKTIYRTANQRWINDSLIDTRDRVYCNQAGGTSLNMSGRSEIKYSIKLNKAGKVVEFIATDGTYQYKYIKKEGGILDLDKINTTTKDSGPYNCNINTCNMAGCNCTVTSVSGTYNTYNAASCTTSTCNQSGCSCSASSASGTYNDYSSCTSSTCNQSGCHCEVNCMYRPSGGGGYMAIVSNSCNNCPGAPSGYTYTGCSVTSVSGTYAVQKTCYPNTCNQSGCYCFYTATGHYYQPVSHSCTSSTCNKSGCHCNYNVSGSYYNYESNAPENMVVQVSKITNSSNKLSTSFACSY